MTREEAAAKLERLRNGGLIHGEAFDMAIIALSTNPCDNCVGVGLAVAYGYTDMRIKKPKIEVMKMENE